MCPSCFEINLNFKKLLAGDVHAFDAIDTQRTLEPPGLRFTLDCLRTALGGFHVMDMPARVRGSGDQRAVLLFHPALDKHLIEVPLKLPRCSEDEKTADFRIQSLRDVKGRVECNTKLMENILHTIVDGRMNRYTLRFVYNNKSVVTMHNRRAPIHSIDGKPLGLQVHAHIVSGNQEAIGTDPFPLVIDSSNRQEAFPLLPAQTEALKTLEQAAAGLDSAVPDAPLGRGCRNQVHITVTRLQLAAFRVISDWLERDA